MGEGPSCCLLRSTRTNDHRDAPVQVELRTVSELSHIPPETAGKHRHLRGNADAHRCCGKSLIGTALVGFGVRQQAWRDPISKRAPSTTRRCPPARTRLGTMRAIGARRNFGLFSTMCPKVFSCTCEIGSVFGPFCNMRRFEKPSPPPM
jgi:hypothetical protein